MTEQEAKEILQVTFLEHWDHVFSQYQIQREGYLLELIQASSDPGLAQILNGHLDHLQRAFDLFKKLQGIPDNYFPEGLLPTEPNQSTLKGRARKAPRVYLQEGLSCVRSWYLRLGAVIKQYLLQGIGAVPAGVFSFLILLLAIGLLWLLLELLG